ncbi:MAG: DUF4340 domain-containing protein [Lachnospiraceae bacterium]|nr:DUF4340 domain-containing protein [Lachnospiraceae bacterium]
MKRQKIQMLILCGLLLVLVAAFFAIRNYNNHQAEENTEEAAYTVLALTEADVKEFSFTGGSETISLIKSDSGWSAVADETTQLDQDTVSSLLSNVLNIQAEIQIEDVTDFSQYGFDDPLATVTLKLQDDTVYEIIFGHYNEVTAQYYLRLDGSNTVYVLSTNLGYHFQISLDGFKKG